MNLNFLKWFGRKKRERQDLASITDLFLACDSCNLEILATTTAVYNRKTREVYRARDEMMFDAVTGKLYHKVPTCIPYGYFEVPSFFSVATYEDALRLLLDGKLKQSERYGIRKQHA